MHLDAPKPWIEVRAATTKNKRPATIFLVPQLVTLLKRSRGAGIGLVLPKGVPSVATLRKDLAAAGIPFQDERDWRLDFHSLRHTYATLMLCAKVDEDSRVEMMRHSEWSQTDNYTDPKFVPLHEGMERLALLLPSSIASLNPGNSCPEQGTAVQSDTPLVSAEVVDLPAKSSHLANPV